MQKEQEITENLINSGKTLHVLYPNDLDHFHFKDI